MKNNHDAPTHVYVASASNRRPLSASRRAILALLRDQPEAVNQHAIERQTGLHGNTIREHLVALTKLGLIRRFKDQPNGKGRPAWLYESAALPEHSGHADLAVALADTILTSSADPTGDAIRAGELWGASMAQDVQLGAGPAHDRVFALLSDLGFSPEPDPMQPGHIKLRHCPMLGAAVRSPDVVCSVHLGIAKGAMAELGGDPGGCELQQFAEPGACSLSLH
ncbi:MAG: helix-turn-helix domain-containing protein [Nocardioidaceae bacterium]